MTKLPRRRSYLNEQTIKKKFAKSNDQSVTEYQKRRFMQLVRHRPMLAAGMIGKPEFGHITQDPSMEHALMMLLAELRKITEVFQIIVASMRNRLSAN